MKGNIVLIGMMGTFKSSAGKVLASNLDMLFLDTDELIAFEYGLSIKEIFQQYGEDFFRELERRIIKRVSEYENVVISCGGGVVLNPKNMGYLRENGYIVLLTASAEEIFNRIGVDEERPLITCKEDISRLITQRRDMYYAHADVVVDNTSLTSTQTADKIEEGLADFLRRNL